MKPVPAIVRGQTFPSIRQASIALGVPYNTLWWAIERGDNDARPMRARGPVTIDGVTYPSQAAAAAALGVVPSTISKRLRRAA